MVPENAYQEIVMTSASKASKAGDAQPVAVMNHSMVVGQFIVVNSGSYIVVNDDAWTIIHYYEPLVIMVQPLFINE